MKLPAALKIGPFRFGLIAFSIPATGIQRSPVIFIVISTVVFVSKTNLISFVQLALRWPPPIKLKNLIQPNFFRSPKKIIQMKAAGSGLGGVTRNENFNSNLMIVI